MPFRHLLAMCALLATVDSQATLIHQYDLNGSLADTLGGPALVANGGSVAATAYAFQPNQGLQLRQHLGAVYTIDMMFHFDALGSYRKIVDFSDLKDDAGFYVYGNGLTFYGIGNTSGTLAAGKDTRLTFSRGADALVNIYQDGKLVMSRKDTQPYTNLSSTWVNFFRDDRNGGEAGPGAVDFIHIYDTALNAAEVNSLANPVSEPDGSLLMAGGLGLLGLALRRRA